MAKTKDEMILVPKHQIMAYARLLLPEIQKYFESEEGQQEFAEYLAQQSQQEGVAV